ncbi:unnamed protein product [Rotaria sordida]|uniref:SHOCT domain-containing protein n=1 Tax=Rotaria sordida TaxID=392033 RepID=A0A813RP01_9BILA|nr:unnamed protein product [Rotaria sordida]
MSKQRKFVAIAAIVGVIAMFLPWASVSAMGYSNSVNGLHGVGYLAFLAFGGAIAVSMIGKQDENLDKRMWIVALGCGAIAFLITLYALLDLPSGGGGFVSVNIGVGLYLALAAGAGVVACAWIFKKADDTLQSGFDALKSEMGTNTPPPASPSKVDELAKLADLKAQGKITDAEYEDMKSKL